MCVCAQVARSTPRKTCMPNQIGPWEPRQAQEGTPEQTWNSKVASPRKQSLDGERNQSNKFRRFLQRAFHPKATTTIRKIANTTVAKATSSEGLYQEFSSESNNSNQKISKYDSSSNRSTVSKCSIKKGKIKNIEMLRWEKQSLEMTWHAPDWQEKIVHCMCFYFLVLLYFPITFREKCVTQFTFESWTTS
jgi:acyl transferase domain-containing protein